MPDAARLNNGTLSHVPRTKTFNRERDTYGLCALTSAGELSCVAVGDAVKLDDYSNATTGTSLLLLLLLLLLPLCRVFILVHLKHTMSPDITVLQLSCGYYSSCIYRYLQC